MNQGDLHTTKEGVHAPREPKSPCAEVRAPVVAMKPGNAGGAKGCREVDTAKTEMTEDKSARVSSATKQAEEARRISEWAEPSVWTSRMVTALIKGVKGGCWFSLIDKVYTLKNLEAAFRRVERNKGAPGVDWVTVEAFARQRNENLRNVHEALSQGTYKPNAIRRVQIPKPGTNETRPLGIPTVRDRVVQAAVLNVLEPIFERGFSSNSYGFRPGRGCKDALRKVDWLLRSGFTWVVDVDLKSYFDTIDHDKLMELIKRKVADSKVLALLRTFLEQEVMEELQGWTPEAGTPQGAVISPLLSNIYLDPLDHHMEGRYPMVRYADDFVILCRSEEHAKKALEEVKRWTEQVRLTIHPTKTRIVNAREDEFAFLGYVFTPKYRWPRKKSIVKLKDRIREETRRANGRSLTVIINTINSVLRGWFEYFKHSYPTIFLDLDKWIRMRLRSILRKRQGKKGRGRGADHQRWPNQFFAGHGLYSLEAAHAHALSALKRGTH